MKRFKVKNLSMPAIRFLGENYCGRLGFNAFDVWDHVRHCPKDDFGFVGFVEAKKLPILTRDSGYAVMLFQWPRKMRMFGTHEDYQIGGEEFWLHVSSLNFEV